MTDNPLSEVDDYRVEVCIALRKLERLDKDELTEDERADAEEVWLYYIVVGCLFPLCILAPATETTRGKSIRKLTGCVQ